MRFFKKLDKLSTPVEVKRLRKETHEAARDASAKVHTLNKIMANGITFKIFLATGGKYRDN